LKMNYISAGVWRSEREPNIWLPKTTSPYIPRENAFQMRHKPVRFRCRFFRNGILDEDVFTFMTISRYILLRRRHVLDKSSRENQNTHFMFINFFPKMQPFMKQSRKIW
jgi:hypothetical protein